MYIFNPLKNELFFPVDGWRVHPPLSRSTTAAAI
jgi:hypothetical protein